MGPQPGNSAVSSSEQKRALGKNVWVAVGLAILGWVLGIGMTLAAIFGHASRHDRTTHINEVIYGPFFLLFAVLMTAVVYRIEHPARARWQPVIERDRWLRNPHQIYGIAVPLFFAAAVWGAFALIGLEQRDQSQANNIALCVFFGSLAAVFLWCGVRKLRAGILLTADHVVVRGMFRTWRMRPDEVTGFTPVLRGTACPLLHRAEASSVPVFCLSRGTIARAGQVPLLADMAPICEHLNAVLANVRGLSQLPAGAPPELSPKAQHANYRTARVLLTSFALTVIALGVAAIVLTHKLAASIAVMLVIAGNTLTCWVALKANRKALPARTEPPMARDS